MKTVVRVDINFHFLMELYKYVSRFISYKMCVLVCLCCCNKIVQAG